MPSTSKRQAEAPPPIVQVRPLYLARKDAAAFLALSRSNFESLVARGLAPKPRKISERRSAWLLDELEAWGRARPESDILPPEHSGYGRSGKP